MLTLEQAKQLKTGDVIRQHTGWDNGMVVSTCDWIVKAVTSRTIHLHNPQAVWGGSVVIRTSSLPLEHWSVKEIGA